MGAESFRAEFDQLRAVADQARTTDERALAHAALATIRNTIGANLEEAQQVVQTVFFTGCLETYGYHP